MKRSFLLFICIAVYVHVQAQDYEVKLFPNETFKSSLALRPSIGSGKGLNLPVVFNWNQETNMIDIILQGDMSEPGKQIYFFNSKQTFREVARLERDVWFSKEIRNAIRDGFIQSCYGSLINVTIKNWPETKKIVATPEIAAFQFEVQDPNNRNLQIEIRFYTASNQKKFLSKRNKRIDYLAKISFNISLMELCEHPELLQTLDVIKVRTKQLNTMIENIDSLISKTNCTQVRIDEIRLPAAEYKEIQVTDKYDNCNEIASAIKLFNETLLMARSRKCPDPAPTPCPPDVCRAMLRALESANPKLYALTLRIQQDRNGENVALLREEYRTIKSSVDAVSCPTCNTRGNTAFEAYVRWCAGIDNLLK